MSSRSRRGHEPHKTFSKDFKGAKFRLGDNEHMNSLLLGGNGFIGSHLVDKLLASGHGVRVFDKYEEHYRKSIAGVEYFFGDFGNRGLVAKALDNVDIVFHLISTTLPQTSNDDPVFDVQSNVVETLLLLEQCVARKIQKLVFFSSGGTVYGRPKILPISEDSPTNPECSYGITKLIIEKYLTRKISDQAKEDRIMEFNNLEKSLNLDKKRNKKNKPGHQH